MRIRYRRFINKRCLTPNHQSRSRLYSTTDTAQAAMVLVIYLKQNIISSTAFPVTLLRLWAKTSSDGNGEFKAKREVLCQENFDEIYAHERKIQTEQAQDTSRFRAGEQHKQGGSQYSLIGQLKRKLADFMRVGRLRTLSTMGLVARPCFQYGLCLHSFVVPILSTYSSAGSF